MAEPINTVALAPSGPENVAEMEKYGITKKPIDYYFYGEYRYTTLRDALAQAKRMAGPA
jgi:hypothetical protein